MRLWFFILLYFPLLPSAQNLLMNGDFEDENICTEYEKNCAPEGWISTSLHADYYFDDATNAFKNQHFIGLVSDPFVMPDARNFLRSRLLCGLRKGAQYQLQFYIRSAHPVFDSIGIYFSAADFLYQKEKIRNSRPQLYLASDTSLRQQVDEWQKVSLTYTATGNENFITIGDFKTKAHKWQRGRPDLRGSFYFFIDAMSLVPLNPAEHLCAEAAATKEEEYSFNVRHDKLSRMVYIYTKNPPPIIPVQKTIVQRIDTLVVPDIFFATNSYALSAMANNLLDSFVTTAKQLQIDSVVVEGHTDNQGSVTLNQKLSENRASSVAGYLQRQLARELYTRGLASEKPVADNRTAGGRQKNRRVEIYIYVRE
jgi:outer membrane protein OmpA-like peptidoglycan-associated protein